MKAKPLIYRDNDYHPCEVQEATHVELHFPCGRCPHRILPVILKGPRRETRCWSWNGDTERPTLRPSILTRFTYTLSGNDCAIDEADIAVEICHTFVNDGQVQFLDDCTHECVGKTLPLLEVEE